MTVIRIFTLPVRIIIKAGAATTTIVVGSGMPGCIVLLMFLGGISMIIKQQRFIRQVYPKPSQKAIARLQDGLDIVNTGEFAFTLQTTAEWQDTGVTFAPSDWIYVEYASREDDQDSDRGILSGRIGSDPADQFRVRNGDAEFARVFLSSENGPT